MNMRDKTMLPPFLCVTIFPGISSASNQPFLLPDSKKNSITECEEFPEPVCNALRLPQALVWISQLGYGDENLVSKFKVDSDE